MSVYIVALLKFTDVDRYRRYQQAFPEVFARFNGTAVIADEAPRRLEGDWAVDKVVVLGFPSEGDAAAFQESPEYQAISNDRKAGADATVFIVRGLGG